MSSNWIPRKTRNAIYARDNMVCCYCGKTCKPSTYAGMTRAEQADHMRANYNDIVTLDHIVSQWELAQASESNADFIRKQRDPRNIVAVCNGCNSSKKKTELYVWATRKGYGYGMILNRIDTRINA